MKRRTHASVFWVVILVTSLLGLLHPASWQVAGAAAPSRDVGVETAVAPGTVATSHTFTLPVTADAEVNTHYQDKNLGTQAEMKVLADTGDGHFHRPLFWYDLASILPGSTVISATAHFYVTEKDLNPVNIHRVTARWAENSVTWNSFNEGFLAAPSGSFVPDPLNQMHSADITSLVADWVSGAQRNRGLALLSSVEKKDSKYATQEDSQLEHHSYLEVVVENAALHTYADDFAPSGSYVGSDGSELWTFAWQEIGESDGAGAGLIRSVTNAKCPAGDCFKVGAVSGSLTGMGIRRQVDLSAAVAASLSFSYVREDANALLYVEVSRDGGSNWHRLDAITLESNDGGHGYKSYDITPYSTAATQVRFIGEQTGGVNDKGVFIDNVTVAYLDGSALGSGIGDRIWDDLNRDGVQDAGEPGLADVAVKLYTGECGAAEDPAFRSTTTNTDGEYFFALLYAGNYCVVVDEQTLPADYASTAARSPLEVTLTTGQVASDADFGYATAFAGDRLTVAVYAPCNDIAWLQQIASDHNATFLVQDAEACTFTLGASGADMPGLRTAVAGSSNTRDSAADVYAGGAQAPWPNDPDYNNPTRVYGPQQISAPAAWAVTTGDPNLIVAVVDTGIDTTHPEFAGRLLPGQDFVNNDGDPTDDNGHGTHVAGIIAAAVNNSLGIAGMAGNVKLLPVKVLDQDNRGWWSVVGNGITWAVDHGARVINLSLGGATESLALQNAINYAVSKGVIVVAAAGNNGTSTLVFPASYGDVLALGATTFEGIRWPLSSYGANVDALAPGSTIYSTYPGGGYRFMSGTSMAAPHATGLAALLLSVDPNLAPDEIANIILSTADDMGDPELNGAGRINAGAAVGSITAQPYAPPVTHIATSLVNDLSANEIVDPGDTVRYLITAVNNNASPLPNVVVSSTLPAHTTYVPGTTRINGIPIQDNATGTPFPLDDGGLNIGTVPANNSAAVSFDVTVNVPTPVFYSLYNQAFVEAGGGLEAVEVTTPIGGDACALGLKNSAGNLITTLQIGFDLHIILTDPDQNTRPGVRQTITALVSNPTTSDSETVILTETDLDTGVFQGQIQLSKVLGQAVADGFLNVTAVGQSVNVAYTDPDFSPDQCSGSISTLAPGSADLRVTQTVSDSTPDEGQSFAYTIKVKNNGPAIATSILIRDVAPAGINFITGNATYGDFDYETGLWLVGQLPVGAEATLIIDAEVYGDSGSTINNTASVWAVDQADPVASNNSATVAFTVNPADLQVTKAVDVNAPDEGQVVRYTVNVKNTGPAALATGIVLKDVLPAGMSFTQASVGQGSYDNATGLWRVGALTMGANATLLLDAMYTNGFSGQPITNTARVERFDQADNNPANDAASAIVTPKTADLRVQKSVDNTGPLEGQTIAYTVKVKNQGPAALATGIVVRDVLPAGLTFASATAQQGSYSSATGLWTVGNLANDVEVALTLNATVNSGTSGQRITNRAEVASFDQMDHAPANDFATKEIIVAPADLQITKTVSDNTPDEGQEIQYTVNVKNNGPSFATGIVISDVLPAGLTFVSANPDVGSYNAATGLWTLNTTLNSGITKKVVIKAKPNAGSSGQTIVNRAEVNRADQLDDDPRNNADVLPVTVNGVDITIAISVDENQPGENQNIVYTVGVKNNGPASLATGIVISDALPSGLTFVSASAQQGSYDPATRRWTVGSLASGVTKNLYVTAYVSNGTFGQKLIYLAQLVAVDQFETNANGNTRTKEITVDDTDIAVTKSIKNDQVSAFGLAEYTIQVTHNGPAANVATGLVISDVLPAGLTFVSANPDQGTYNPATGLWSVGSLASGVTKKLVLKATVQPMNPAAPTIVNTAALHSLVQHENTANNNSDSASLTYKAADIAITKKVNDTTPDEGDAIVFTLEARNYGPASVAGVLVRDVLPAGLTYAGATATDGSYDPATGIWTISNLILWDGTAAAKPTLTINASVDAGAHGLAITNTATSLLAQPDLVATNNSDSAVVNVRAPDVLVTKTVNNTHPDEGQTIIYTVRAKNNGPAEMNATNVVISDSLPLGLTLVSAAPTQGSYSAATGRWTIPAIPKGVTYDLVLNARVNTGTSGQTITNTATLVSYDQRDPNLANNAASATIQVGAADVRVTKTVNDAAPGEGQVVQYTVNAKNNGPAPATGVVISDVLPAGVTFVSAAAEQGVYDGATGLWSVGSLAVNADKNLVLSARVNLGTAGQTITNRAAVHALDQRDELPTNDAASIALTPQAIDLRALQTVNDATPDEGQVILYTVKVKNLGPRDATGVVVRDILPATLTFTSASATQGSYDKNTGLWTIGALASGVEKALTLNAQVNAGTSGTTITNTATIHALDQTESNPLNNSVAVPVKVNTADLRVTKTVNDEAPDEGQVIRYTVNVKNNGPAPATSVVIGDRLPAGVTFDAATRSQGTYDRNTGLWSVGTLAAGASANLYLDAKVNTGVSGQAIVNTAAVHSLAQADVIAANNSASVTISVQKADLLVTKTVNDAAPDEGDVIVYTVKAKNLGPSYAADLVLEDILPAGVAYIGHTVTHGVYDHGTGLWVVGDLLKDATATLTIRVAINRGTSGQSIANTASVRNVEQSDPVVTNNRATATINVRAADLRILKTVNDTTPNEGQAIAYTIKVKNQGPSVATGIQVADVLPQGLTFVSAVPAQGSYDPVTGIWTVGDLNSGVEKALVINVTVDAGTGASTIVNRAGIFAVDQADNIGNNDQASSAVIVNGADLDLTKLVNDSSPVEGQTVRYTLTLLNRGPLAAASIIITDRLPAGVTHLADSSGGTYNPATGAWTIATLNSGAAKVLTIDARVNAGTRDSVITNEARIGASSQPDSLTNNNYAAAKIAIGDADLRVSAGVDDTSPDVGDPVIFTVRLENRGPDSASGAKVNFALPRGLRYTSYNSTQGSYSPATGVWSVGNLSKPVVAAAALGLEASAGSSGQQAQPAKASIPEATDATLTLTAVVEEDMASQTVGATASIAGVDQNDPSAGNNQATVSFTVHGADLALTQSVNSLYPSVGDAVVYTLTLSNGGPDAATNVQVTDYWPGRVIFGAAAASAGSYDSATGRWSVPSLAAAGSATLRLSGVLAAGVESNIANIAEITAADQPDGDSTPANHASSEDDYSEIKLFTGVPPVVDGKLDLVYSLSPDVQRVCYTANGMLFGVWHVLARPAENAIYTALVIDKEFVDNTYGANAVGWPSGHSFSQLVGSDHAQFIGYDANGVEVTDFKLDYLGSGFATPSGYDNAGVLAGDTAAVLQASSSLVYNLNALGYCADGDCAIGGTNLVVDSPATDAFYTPNPTYPGWIYDVIYEAKIDVAAFGPAGFGSLVVPYIHASPSKAPTGNTIVALPGICPGEIGDTVWHDADTNGLQGDGENGLDGVSVSLYRDDGDGRFDQTGDSLIGTETTQAGGRYLFQDVQPGGYFVNVVDSSVPAGFSLNTNNDPTNLITLAAEQSYRDADFGYASLDFGDAPDPSYPTRHANNGAHHIVDGVTFLGGGVDNDADGQPGPTALGDDQSDGNDDEDGVIFTTILRQGQWAALDVTASRSGRLNAWIDYAADGDWADAGDHAIVDYPLVAGANQIYLLVPFNASVGTTYARFRFSTVSALSFTGEAPNGEVEDYRIEVEAPVGGAAGPGSIGDFVWHDQDGDGIQDPGEPGIAGVGVSLTNHLGMTTVLTTTATGRYVFSVLPAGTYTVALDAASTPAIYNFATTPSQYVIALASGVDFLSADFGLQTLATIIGDYIWYDTDADGVQDVGEPGIANVTLGLYLDDGDGVFEPTPALGSDFHIGSTVSDAAGAYALRAPVAGIYFVDVTDDHGLLAGMNHTFGPQSMDEPSPPIAVNVGDIYQDADFGYVVIPAPAVIGDLVWVDGNRNGVREVSEPILIGVEVCATPAGGGDNICDVTDMNGRYLLQVTAGDYSVAPTVSPLGLTPTTAIPQAVSVAGGQQYLDADFGYYGGLAGLGGTIWQDIPVNDSVDGVYTPAAEPGIPNVSVNVIQDIDADRTWDAGEPILSTFSNTGGDYLFDSLLTGDYLVKVSDTLGVLRRFAATVPGPNPGQDSNNQHQPYAVNLSLNETDTTADFGYREYEGFGLGGLPDPGVIGDTVWFDVDGDGVYAPAQGDQPIAGVTVSLHRDGAPYATATTGGYGQYLFTDLPLGHNYRVEATDAFGVLVGFVDTAPGPNPTQNNNNQAQPYDAFLGLGAANYTADFGYTQLAEIGDFVFFDLNQDGLQQENETEGVHAIPITLINQATGQQLVLFSVNGVYRFADLMPGVYTVGVPLTHSTYFLTSLQTSEVTVTAGQAYLDADFGYGIPTAVDLVSFTAERQAAGVSVRWYTRSRLDDTSGFVVWRAEAATGPFKAMTGPILPTGEDGLAYTWLDELAAPTMSYWYKLEAVSSGQFFGPISITPHAGGMKKSYLPLVVR